MPGKRSEYKGYPDVFFITDGMFDYICQGACLEEAFPDVRVKGMGGVCPIINTISVLHSGEDIETLEFLQFRLYSPLPHTINSADCLP